MHFRLQSHAFFLLAFLAFYASSCEQEDYWSMKLPKVPMPQAIKENLLHANAIEPITIDNKEKIANFDKPYTAKKDKIVASENQPWTVYGWRYNPETDANAVEPVSHDVATTNAVTPKKDKIVASENQPWTVYGWRYNPETDANAVEPVSHDVATTNTVTTKKDKIVASENQPWTVYGWRYNPETDANAVEPVSHDVATTNIVTTKKDKIVASENQPWTVYGWRYNPETDANAVEPVATTNTVTTKKEKIVASENQPWTVYGWRYNPDNINEKNSIKASHNHHHFMHNANSKDSEVKEENLNGGSVFFVEESLRLGTKLKHDFQKTKKRPYLPKKIAQSIPFSVDKVAEILKLFSIKSKSAEATSIKETLGICLQRPNVKKENRTCAQSMEDIVDFVVKELGTNEVQLRMMRNNIEVAHGIQDYVVTKVKKLVVPGNTAAACHRMVYPYVVYYCHHQQDIGHYDITLVSPTSGNAIQTTAVCHYDTYAWQPDVEALRYLGIRPGDAPVCHFSAINDMFWSIKPTHSKYLDMAQ